MRKIAFLALIMALAVFSACRKHPPRFEDDYPMMRGVEHVYVKAGYEEVIEALTTARAVTSSFSPSTPVSTNARTALPAFHF